MIQYEPMAEDGNGYFQTTIPEAVSRLKSLAAWLEQLPPGSQLISCDETVCFAEDVPKLAKILRLWLPYESRA